MLLKADPISRKRTTFRFQESDESITLHSEQDVEQIMEGNHEMRRHWDDSQRMGTDGAMVGRIPAVIVEDLIRRGIFYDDEALLAWLEDPDNKVWKMHPGNFSRRGKRIIVS